MAESAAVQGTGRVEDDRAGSVDGLGLPGVDDLEGEQTQAGVPVVVVVGVEEVPAERAGFLRGGEGAGEPTSRS